jgi:hypothetical protein
VDPPPSSPYTICVNGTFTNVVGTCQKDPGYCYGSPQHVPGTYGWDCVNAPQGSVCKARCQVGPFGNVTGTYISICSLGSYSTPSGTCRTTISGCTSGPPSPGDLAAEDWPSYCAGVADGETCETPCMAGYEGTIITQCIGGNRWSTTLGVCRSTSIPWKCFTLPPNPPTGSKAYNWPALAKPVYQGGIITAECVKGYLGMLVRTCLGNSNWSNTTGRCYKRPTSCFGPPAFSAGPNATSWIATAAKETLDGGHVTADCPPYSSGEVVAFCKRGQWVGPYGGCFKDSSRCWDPPPNYSGPGAYNFNKVMRATPHGEYVDVSCHSGYVGSVRATCLMGKW